MRTLSSPGWECLRPNTALVLFSHFFLGLDMSLGYLSKSIGNWCSLLNWFFPTTPTRHVTKCEIYPCCCCLVSKLCLILFVTPWSVAHQAPLSMGFPTQESWSGLPFPSPGNLPGPRIKPLSTALANRCFTTESSGKPEICPGIRLKLDFPIGIKYIGKFCLPLFHKSRNSHHLLSFL